VRLPPEYVDAIKTAASAAFGASSVVRLFGSRVNNNLRGGDIDLHIETDPLENEHAARDRFEDELFRKIERQKVDVVITERGRTPRGFERIAYRDGIML
jgi:predicted nucleotidyltransferase